MLFSAQRLKSFLISAVFVLFSTFKFTVVYGSSYHKLVFLTYEEQFGLSYKLKECFVALICKKGSSKLHMRGGVSASRSFKKLLCVSISLSSREQQRENAIIQICMLTLLNCSSIQYITQYSRCKEEGSPLDLV